MGPSNVSVCLFFVSSANNAPLLHLLIKRWRHTNQSLNHQTCHQIKSGVRSASREERGVPLPCNRYFFIFITEPTLFLTITIHHSDHSDHSALANNGPPDCIVLQVIVAVEQCCCLLQSICAVVNFLLLLITRESLKCVLHIGFPMHCHNWLYLYLGYSHEMLVFCLFPNKSLNRQLYFVFAHFSKSSMYACIHLYTCILKAKLTLFLNLSPRRKFGSTFAHILVNRLSSYVSSLSCRCCCFESSK